MRSMKLASLAVFVVSLVVPTLARADAAPIGTYDLVTADGTGIHLSTGTLTGTVTYNASSDVTAADIVYTSAADVSYTFNTPGLTTIGDIASTPDLYQTSITSSANPADSFFLSVEFPGSSDGSFTFTCGVDCDDFVTIGTTDYEEFTGKIVPTPETSSIVLLGTGVLGLAQAIRRRQLKA